jgi:hypothetical protein
MPKTVLINAPNPCCAVCDYHRPPFTIGKRTSAFFYETYTPAPGARYRKFMLAGQRMAPMKTSSLHVPFASRTARGFGLVALALLFLLSVFQLTHPATSPSHDIVDLWRGLAVGSLFLFFCYPTAGRPHSGL